MRCWLALLFLLITVPTVSADAPSAVYMTEPRSFGHFVGDLITRTAEFEVSADEDFVAASLPQPGQLAYWLELRNVEAGKRTHGGTRRLALTLTYQLFYVPIDTRKVKVPASNIELKASGGSRIVTIPAFTFLISPIREIYPEKSGETTATFLKNDATAERYKTGPVRSAVLISIVSTATALLLLAFQRAWWPFHTRPGRPFTEAGRVVLDHRQPYPAALLALHRAFDRANGARLLAPDLDLFLARRPEQSGVRTAAQHFFSASETFFYSGDPVAAEAAVPRSALESLVSHLAENERAGS